MEQFLHSNLFRLNWHDVFRGLVMAVLGSIVTAIYQAVVAHVPITIESMVAVGEIAGLSYIIKNFFSDDEGKFLGGV